MSARSRRQRVPGLFACLALAACCSSAQAASVLVQNAGFETESAQTFNEFSFGAPPGWDFYDPDNITTGGNAEPYFVGTLEPQPDPNNPGDFINFPGGAAEGVRVGIAYNRFGTGGEGEYGLSQVLTATLQANTAYVLQVEIGNIASGEAVSTEFFNLDGFPGYRVDLIAGDPEAGGVILDQDLNTLAGSIAEGAFATSTVSFTTGAAHSHLGQQLMIRLVNLNVVDPLFPNADLEVDFDDVRLDATVVPIPPSLPLLAGAIAGLAMIRRRADALI